MREENIASVLGDKKLRDSSLAEALAEGGGGLLGAMPTHRTDDKRCDPNEGFVLFHRRPTPQELNYANSSPEMIIEGRVVLKDGRRVYWK